MLEDDDEYQDNSDAYTVVKTGNNRFQCPGPPLVAPSAPRAGKKDKNIFSPKN